MPKPKKQQSNFLLTTEEKDNLKKIALQILGKEDMTAMLRYWINKNKIK